MLKFTGQPVTPTILSSFRCVYSLCTMGGGGGGGGGANGIKWDKMG